MHDVHIWSICIIILLYYYSTCAAIESQLGGGVKFLDEELGQ